MPENKVVIEVGVQGDAEVRLKRITEAVTELGGKGTASFSRFSNIFDIFAGNLLADAVGKGFSLATDAAGKFFNVLVVDGIKAAQETQDNVTRLNAALSQNGKYSQTASQALVDFSEELQRTTKFSNDQVLQTEAMISTFARLGEKELKVATKAALDLSTAFGINLESATRMVGKAAAGESDAFGKLRIRFQEGASSADTFANAMAAVNARVGGAAEAQVNTFSGAVAVAGHAFEDFTKEIGNVIINNAALVNIIKKSAEAFDLMGNAVKANSGVLNQWISGAVLAAVESVASLVRMLSKVESVIAGDFGKKVFGPISAELDKMSNSAVKFYAEAIAGAEKAAPAVRQVSDAYEELSQKQIKLIEKGAQLAEQSDPTAKLISEVEALQAALEAKKILEEDYTNAVVALQQQRDEKISATMRDEVDGAVERNQSLLREDERRDQVLLGSSKATLRSLLQNEKLSQKDRAKIQSEITATEAKEYNERVAAGMFALSALASFQNFKSKEMQAIGKAAAIAQTSIATYEGATKAFSALAGIPLVGPALGAAAAAATIAAGLANVARIAGVELEKGGEIPTGFPNDTFPARLTSGENVVDRSTNDRLKGFLSGADTMVPLLQAILFEFQQMRVQTTVNIGNTTIFDQVSEGLRSGRVFDV